MQVWYGTYQYTRYMTPWVHPKGSYFFRCIVWQDATLQVPSLVMERNLHFALWVRKLPTMVHWQHLEQQRNCPAHSWHSAWGLLGRWYGKKGCTSLNKLRCEKAERNVCGKKLPPTETVSIVMCCGVCISWWFGAKLTFRIQLWPTLSCSGMKEYRNRCAPAATNVSVTSGTWIIEQSGMWLCQLVCGRLFMPLEWADLYSGLYMWSINGVFGGECVLKSIDGGSGGDLTAWRSGQWLTYMWHLIVTEY